MPLLFVLLRLALAGVFAVAGVMKLRDLERAREDFEALGLPDWVVTTMTFRLPIIELVVAAMLLIEPLADVGAVCALGLLCLFTIVIAMNLWRGRHPACACFGSLSRGRIGAGTLLRNITLMAAAGTLLIPPPAIAAAFDGWSTASALVIAAMLMGCVILFGAWWVFQLWRQQGRLLLRIEQLEQRPHGAATTEPQPVSVPRPLELVGRPAPALTLHDVKGRRFDLQSLRGGPTLLLFLDASCQHCRPLFKRLSAWRSTSQVIVILAGQPQRALDFAPDIAVVTDDASNAMQAFEVFSTPAAIAIDAHGIVVEPAARGNTAVARLLDRLTELPHEAEAHHELAPV